MCITIPGKLFPDREEIYWALVDFESSKSECGIVLWFTIVRGDHSLRLVGATRRHEKSLKHGSSQEGFRFLSILAT